MQISKINFLITFIILLLSYHSVRADYFAYVPDLSADTGTNKIVHVINYSQQVWVADVQIFGSPRDIQVSHDGLTVYVTSVLSDTSGDVSFLNRINAADNTIFSSRGSIQLTGYSARGIALSANNKTLFVTYQGGVTRFDDITVSNDKSDLMLTYSGITMELSYDEKYLFVAGTDNNLVDGISVVDLNSFTEVDSYSLGAGKAANALVFNRSNNQLYVANQNGNEIVSLRIDNYNFPLSASLSLANSRLFPAYSYPTDLLLSNDNSELYVVLSYAPLSDTISPVGNGYIAILNADDINSSPVDSLGPIDRIDLSNEGSSYQLETAVHPIAINFSDTGELHVLKRLWSDKAGLYLSKIKDNTNVTNGQRTILESSPYVIGNRASTLATGQWLGPECDACPRGINIPTITKTRASSIDLTLLIILLFTFLFRLRKTQ